MITDLNIFLVGSLSNLMIASCILQYLVRIYAKFYTVPLLTFLMNCGTIKN